MEPMGPGAVLQLFRNRAEVESLPQELEVSLWGLGVKGFRLLRLGFEGKP
jgi:hypothetical protein